MSREAAKYNQKMSLCAWLICIFYCPSRTFARSWYKIQACYSLGIKCWMRPMSWWPSCMKMYDVTSWYGTIVMHDDVWRYLADLDRHKPWRNANWSDHRIGQAECCHLSEHIPKRIKTNDIAAKYCQCRWNVKLHFYWLNNKLLLTNTFTRSR